MKPIPRQVLLTTIQSLGSQVHRLLIVDDDPAMARFVAQSFRANGDARGNDEYTLVSAFSGAEGLKIMQENPVDAILLDLELPDIHGWEWLAQVQGREEFARIPVVIVSAQDIPRDNLAPGANALELALRRPLTVNELGNVLKAVLENILPQYPREKE